MYFLFPLFLDSMIKTINSLSSKGEKIKKKHPAGKNGGVETAAFRK